MRALTIALALGAVLLAGCAKETEKAPDGAAAAAAASVDASAAKTPRITETVGTIDTDDAVAAIKSRISLLPWINGRYAAGDASSTYVAFFDGDAPAAVFEQVDLGEYGESRVAHFYEGDALVGHEKWSRQLSSAGAPSDGWYESLTTLRFENGRYVSGSKTVNGEASEPDEHEIRSAGRTGTEIRARAIAVRENPALADEKGPAAQFYARGILLAGKEVALPPGTIARIQLRDVAKADIAAQVIASDDMPLERLPANFILSAPRSLIRPDARLSIFVQVVSGETLLYMTTAHTPVEAGVPVDVNLQQMTATDDKAAGTGGGGMIITPPQVPYGCGGEDLLVAIEAGGAFVTFPDKTTVMLPLAPSADGGKIFSDGKLSVFVADAADGTGAISFARGRAAPVLCARK
ncbi:MAG: YbaY family lipoprotein [Parvularculaceae bacterium]